MVLPICPLCQAAVLLKEGESANDRVSILVETSQDYKVIHKLYHTQVERHIMSGCSELVATSKATKENSLFHRCTYHKCKQKELIAITCDRCHCNFCIRYIGYN